MNGWIRRWLDSIHSGVFMGLFNDAKFQEYDTFPFGQWEGATKVSKFDETTTRIWIRQWVSNDLPKGARILVVGAGGGREIRTLKAMGFDVYGLEFDIDLASETRDMLARVSGCESVEILSPPRYEVPKADGAFDAVIIARFYLSYIHGRDERTRFLSALRRLLNKDGFLAADFPMRPDDPKAPESKAFRLQVRIANFLRKFQKGQNEPIETGDHLDSGLPLLRHSYTSEEIESELIVSGFEVEFQDSTSFGWSIATPGKRIENTGGPLFAPAEQAPAPAAS